MVLTLGPTITDCQSEGFAVGYLYTDLNFLAQNMKITGTFLDEITHDIPANNWGTEQWREDFRLMRTIGIDTVILIRSGCGRIAAYPSEVLKREVGIYPVYEDLVDLFLILAEEQGMDFYFGTYDSVTYAPTELTVDEHLALGRACIDEAWNRYGQRSAFKGWYLTFEVARKDPTRLACLPDHPEELFDVFTPPDVAGLIGVDRADGDPVDRITALHATDDHLHFEFESLFVTVL